LAKKLSGSRGVEDFVQQINVDRPAAGLNGRGAGDSMPRFLAVLRLEAKV